MSLGRLVSSVAAAAAVGGCAVVAVGMSRAADTTTGSDRPLAPLPSISAEHYDGPAAVFAGAAPAAAPTTSAAATPTTTMPTTATPTRPPPGTTAATTRRPTPHAAAAPPATKPAPAHPTQPAPAQVRGGALPLGYPTGSATRVITVTATSTHSTTARLQAWTKATGGGWLKHGSAVTAHVGSDGLTASPSEFRSATPIGSFTLTQAFGYNSDPGTALPYFRTTPADWWISQSGSLYNTHQRCSTNCPFTLGAPNEHLYYETPYYNYAVVINTPFGRSAYPHGSAFFLHVTDGNATAGCVAIAQSTLVSLMKWLSPSTHPRILIGVT